MHSFIRFAVDKPIINHIFMLFILILALFSYQNISKEIFPPSQMDQIVIRGGYAGTSADVLDKMLVKNIEDSLKAISEIESVNTVIQNGLFNIHALIKTNSNNQLVLGDVKDVITSIRRDLPSDMAEPIANILTQEFPLLLIAVSGDVPKARLLEVAEALKNRLNSYEDLSGIAIRGDADNEVKIKLDTKKLIAYGISEKSMYQAISNLSSIYPIGAMKQKGNHLFVSTISGEKDAKALGATILSVDGKMIRLKDVAELSFGLSESREISHFNGLQNVSININKTKEGNAIALSKEVKKMLKEAQKEYSDVVIVAYTDTSIWIRNRLNLVSSNILFGLMLVFLALLLSVNYKIAIVVAGGIFTSFMLTLVVMDLIGYSLNMLTLLGALIALGMIVDEAIVVGENIFRHMEMGKSPRDAAIDGALEMFPAVLTATLTTVFAFLPLLILSGDMGLFMKVLPVMISILLVSSLFEAFYFLPLHAKELYSLKRTKKEDGKNNFWIKINAFYTKILAKSLQYKNRSLFLLLSFIILSTIGIISITKFQLFPEFDSTQIYLNAKVDVNHKLEDTAKIVAKLEKDILDFYKNKEKEISSITSVTGLLVNADQTFETGSNVFHIFINLHEKAPENFFNKYLNPIFSLEYDDSDMIRERKAQDVAKMIQDEVLGSFIEKSSIHGKSIFSQINLFVPQAGIVSHDIEIGLHAKNEQEQLDSINILTKELSEITGVFDVNNNAKEGARELKLRVNEYGQRLGFSEGYLTSILQGSFLDTEYAKMFDDDGLVRIRVVNIDKDKAVNISSFKVTSPDGTKRVRLDEISDFMYKTSFVKIHKEDGKRVHIVTARVENKIILATEVMEKIKPLLERFEKEGITVIIKGEEKENKQMQKEMTQAAIIAMFLIFITLVWMFNSFVLPLIIISTIPLSIVGALAGTYMMGIHFTMPGAMGMIGLAGVVVNDGLIMLSFIRKSKNFEGLQEKAAQRLRPILLTSVTTVLGLSSMIFFASGQALLIQPMAISLGFGVAWATVLNLYYVPLIYAVIYKVKEKD